MDHPTLDKEQLIQKVFSPRSQKRHSVQQKLSEHAADEHQRLSHLQ